MGRKTRGRELEFQIAQLSGESTKEPKRPRVSKKRAVLRGKDLQNGRRKIFTKGNAQSLLPEGVRSRGGDEYEIADSHKSLGKGGQKKGGASKRKKYRIRMKTGGRSGEERDTGKMGEGKQEKKKGFVHEKGGTVKLSKGGFQKQKD